MRTKREIEIDIENKGWEIYIDMDGIHITSKVPIVNRNYFVLDMYNKKFYSSCYNIDFEIGSLVNELIKCILKRRKNNDT